MSYLVLARKWRPMRFADVVSQEHVTVTLVNAIRQNRLASAYLFSGPRGVGKTTTARILAKAINCDQGPSPEPCNQCDSCVEITEGRSLDVFEIDGASNRGIDEVRSLREQLRYAPSPGKHKIYIIDEVHMLTTEAFNALLKTLEEPPSHVLFVLATTEFHKVPATIASRCQRFDFRRIPLNAIVEHLQKICSAEGIQIDADTLMLIARKADGSLRDGQSLLDQMVSFCGLQIHTHRVIDLLGLIDQELFFETATAVKDRDVRKVLDLADKVFTQGLDLSEFLTGLGDHFRNLLVVLKTGDGSLLSIPESDLDRLQEQAGNFADLDLLRLIQIATEAAQQVKFSSNPKLRLEMALLKMAHLDRSVDVDELLKGLQHLKKKNLSATPEPAVAEIPLAGSTGAVPRPVGDRHQGLSLARSSAPAFPVPELKGQVQPPTEMGVTSASSIEVNLEALQRAWSRVIEEVKKTRISLGSFLAEGFPTAVQGDLVEISFGKDNGFHLRTVQGSRDFLQRVISEVTGMRVRIVCRQTEKEMVTTPGPEYPAAEQPRPLTLETLAREHPIVQKMVELFDIELIPQH